MGEHDGINVQDLLAQYPGAGLATDPNARYVYTGQQSPQGEHSGPAPYLGGSVSYDTAKTMFAGFNPGEQQAMANKLFRAGILDSPNDVQGAYSVWQQAVSFAADAYTAGRKTITPWDIIQQQIGASSKAVKRHGPDQTVDTSYDMLAPGDAANMVRTMYQNELGRDPSKGELARYTSMLINKVKSTPTATVTQNTYDSDGNIVAQTHQKTQPGVSSAELGGMVLGGVHADPEYGAYQAATSYMGAIQSLFGGSPDLTGSNG